MKYLTFLLADQSCAIELAAVRELLGYMPFTPANAEHPAIVGWLHFRGRGVRVIDLRIRFGLPVTRTDDTVMIIAETNGETFAVIVDNVTGLANITALVPAATHHKLRVDSGFVAAVATVADRTTALIDMPKALVIPPPLTRAA